MPVTRFEINTAHTREKLQIYLEASRQRKQSMGSAFRIPVLIETTTRERVEQISRRWRMTGGVVNIFLFIASDTRASDR